MIVSQSLQGYKAIMYGGGRICYTGRGKAPTCILEEYKDRHTGACIETACIMMFRRSSHKAVEYLSHRMIGINGKPKRKHTKEELLNV